MELECGDYTANDGLWLSVRGASIKINPTDDGIVVDIYRVGREDREAIASTWVSYDELVQGEFSP